MTVSKRIVLHFPSRVVDQPIVYKLVKDFDLEFNIIRAMVSPGREGILVMELTGDKKDYERGIKYVKESGVKVQPLSQDVVRNDDRCTQCGACLTLCPTDCFALEPKTQKVLFDNSRCVVCEMCVRACPPRAMELHF